MVHRRKLLIVAIQLGDELIMCIAFGLAALVSGYSSEGANLRQFLAIRISLANVLLFVGFAILWHLLVRSSGLYRSRRIGSWIEEWRDIGKVALLGTLALPALALLFDLEAIGRSFLVTFFLVVFLGGGAMRTLGRVVLMEARRHGRNLRSAVVVGCGPRGAALGRQLRERTDLGYVLLGFIDDIPAPMSTSHSGPEKMLGSIAEIETILKSGEVDEVFVTLPMKSQYDHISRILQLAEDLGITVRMPADFFNLQVLSARIDYLEELPLMIMGTPRPSVGSLLVKRALDIVGSVLGLLLAAPLFLAVALAIKLDSPGPVFFRQVRVGLNRRLFTVLKFRTMVTGAEARLGELAHLNEVEGAAFKIQVDPRVTRVGRILRKFSIDELPQIGNVLVGDMSLVGPRPLPERDVEAFDHRWLHRRFSVKPGLTCLWQANGRHNIAFDEWMELDLQYIDQWSFGLDLEIILRTIPAVLRGTGAS